MAKIIEDETIDLSADEETAEASMRGKIVVTVRRGKSASLPEDGKGYRPPVPLLPPKTSKKVGIDYGKSHRLKYVGAENIFVEAFWG